jgi:hypothetical protein
MTNRIQKIINNLYKATLSPAATEEYLQNTDILTIIDHILKSVSRSQNYPAVSDNEITNLVFFSLKLVDVPLNLQGSLLIEPCILFLIQKACGEVRVQQGIERVVLMILSDWFEALKNAPKAKTHYNRKPEIGKCPLLRFHLDSYNDSKIGTNASLYEAFAYPLHKAIRKNEEYKIKNGFSEATQDSYIRAARFFFKYIPTEIKAKTEHPYDVPQEYIEKFGRGYDIAENKNYDSPLGEVARDYQERLLSLLSLRMIKPKHHTGHKSKLPVTERAEKNRNFLKPDSINGEMVVLRKDGYLPKIIQYIDCPDKYEKFEFGEGKDDDEGRKCSDFEAKYEIYRYEITEDSEQPKPIIPQRPSIKRRYEDLINLRNFHFYWDSDNLSLFHYAILYKVLNESWNKSPLHNAAVVYLYMLIHTGIDGKKLFDLKITNNELETVNVVKLIRRDERYYILNPSVIELKKLKGHISCLKTSPVVWVPVPEPIGSLLDDLIKNGSENVFSYRDGTNRLVRLNKRRINEFIKEEINVAYAQYELKISIANISSSFLPLYHHHFGLDPLICCYISGEDRHRLYRSQMHYINIDRTLLENEYLNTFAIVNEAIYNNLSDCINKGFVSAESTQPNVMEQIPSNSVSVINSKGFSGYGSPIIPNDEYITSMIDTLKKYIINEKDYVIRHNIFSIYAYLCLQFSTGLRPRNEPELTWDNYNEYVGTIAINDKQSAKYREERILPLPRTAKLLMQRLKTGFKDLQIHIAKYIYPSILKEEQNNIFFFVDTQSGRFEGYTLKRMRELLFDIGIDYILPMNMPRHYMRTYLYDAGISNEAADMWMGHQHAGKEAFNMASSTILINAVKTCLPVIEDMLNKLGFLDVRHLP